MAGPVAFLLSDLAAYVTGQVLVVDGGMLARPPFDGADDLPVFVRDADLRSRRLAEPPEPSARGGAAPPALTHPPEVTAGTYG